jgi:hypothetical protein
VKEDRRRPGQGQDDQAENGRQDHEAVRGNKHLCDRPGRRSLLIAQVLDGAPVCSLEKGRLGEGD